MWWKVYLVLLVVMEFHVYQHILIDFDISNSYKGLFFSSIQVLGLIGFIVRKRLISQIFWKVFLFASVGWGLYTALNAFSWYSGINIRSMLMFFIALSPIILYAPVYRALYLYSYRSDSLWNRTIEN